MVDNPLQAHNNLVRVVRNSYTTDTAYADFLDVVPIVVGIHLNLSEAYLPLSIIPLLETTSSYQH